MANLDGIREKIKFLEKLKDDLETAEEMALGENVNEYHLTRSIKSVELMLLKVNVTLSSVESYRVAELELGSPSGEVGVGRVRSMDKNAD